MNVYSYALTHSDKYSDGTFWQVFMENINNIGKRKTFWKENFAKYWKQGMNENNELILDVRFFQLAIN